MSQIIHSIEQTTANMMKAERKRYITELYIAGLLTTTEYNILKGEIL